LAGIYQGLKNLEKSREYYKKQTEIDPENPIPYYAIASTDWLRMRDKAHPLSEEEKVQAIEEGLQYADKALEKNPNYVDAMAYKNLLLRDKAAATKIRQKPNAFSMKQTSGSKRRSLHATLPLRKRRKPRSFPQVCEAFRRKLEGLLSYT
jgi:tetratricopeptide (TPR) repeat protein